jgi:hypothetical protein
VVSGSAARHDIDGPACFMNRTKVSSKVRPWILVTGVLLVAAVAFSLWLAKNLPSYLAL